jgi:hypothetical protein
MIKEFVSAHPLALIGLFWVLVFLFFVLYFGVVNGVAYVAHWAFRRARAALLKPAGRAAN